MIDPKKIADLKLDEIDIQIITMLEEDPNLTHSAIARQIDRSQPAVGSRIHKLEDRGILRTQVGVDFQKFPLYLAKVELFTKNPAEIEEMAECCPFVINAMKLSGSRNMCLLLASTDLRKLDAIVDYHFRDRNKNDVQKVKMEMITGFIKTWVLPVNFDSEHHNPTPTEGCGENCHVYLKHLEEEGRI